MGKKILIKCNGYWITGPNECKFQHYGNWSDKELIEHEKIEQGHINKHHFWLGFEQIQIFGKRERTSIDA